MTHAIRGFLSSRIIGVLTISLFCCASAFAGEGNEHWVGTWGTALHAPDLGVPGLANTGFKPIVPDQVPTTPAPTEEQVAVIAAPPGPLVVIAGAAGFTALLMPATSGTVRPKGPTSSERVVGIHS